MPIITNVEVGKLIGRVEFDATTEGGRVGVTVKRVQLTVESKGQVLGRTGIDNVTVLGEIVEAKS